MGRATRLQMRTVLAVALVMLATSQLLTLDAAGAGFRDTTVNIDNAVEALAVEPPTDVSGSTTLNLLPLATCRVHITWTASDTPEVASYEVVRLYDSVEDERWDVDPDVTETEDTVSAELVESKYRWELRTRRASWSSSWVDATPPDFLLICLL